MYYSDDDDEDCNIPLLKEDTDYPQFTVGRMKKWFLFFNAFTKLESESDILKIFRLKYCSVAYISRLVNDMGMLGFDKKLGFNEFYDTFF